MLSLTAELAYFKDPIRRTTPLGVQRNCFRGKVPNDDLAGGAVRSDALVYASVADAYGHNETSTSRLVVQEPYVGYESCLLVRNFI